MFTEVVARWPPADQLRLNTLPSCPLRSLQVCKAEPCPAAARFGPSRSAAVQDAVINFLVI